VIQRHTGTDNHFSVVVAKGCSDFAEGDLAPIDISERRGIVSHFGAGIDCAKYHALLSPPPSH
jgi:hypothetical protein